VLGGVWGGFCVRNGSGGAEKRTSVSPWFGVVTMALLLAMHIVRADNTTAAAAAAAGGLLLGT